MAPSTTDRAAYIEMLMSWGRPELLKLTRSLGVKAGNVKDTREIATLLWNIKAMNERYRDEKSTRGCSR